VLIGQTPVPEPDLLTWAMWMETGDRHVRHTRVGPYFVSTIFLGLDHNHFRYLDPENSGPPILFETMVYVHNPHTVECFGKEITFNSDFLDIQERCSTWLEAEAQHQRVIDQIREGSDDIEEVVSEGERSSVSTSEPS